MRYISVLLGGVDTCVSVAYDLHKIIIRIYVRVGSYEPCVKQNHRYSVREKNERHSTVTKQRSDYRDIGRELDKKRDKITNAFIENQF